MDGYETIQAKSCNEMIAGINKQLSKGMLFNITAARKRIRQINESVETIRKYVELNAWFLDVQCVIDNQRRVAKLLGEKDALVKIIADRKKHYKEI